MPIPSQEIRLLAEDGELGGIDPELIQPASVDLRIADDFLVYHSPSPDFIIPVGQKHGLDLKPAIPGLYPFEDGVSKAYRMYPGDFMLARTQEHIRIPAWLVGQVTGRSSIGRLGLAVHVTAGWIDPGFEGTITLELVNLNPNSLVIRPGTVVATLIYYPMTEIPNEIYRGRYKDQQQTTPSRLHWQRNEDGTFVDPR